MKLANQIYNRSPGPIQDVMAMAYGLFLRVQRYGSTYRREFESLLWSDLQPAEVLRSIQSNRLRALIDHAFSHVPHYRDMAGRLRITSADVTLDTLHEIFPVLDRETVKAEKCRFVSDAFSRRQTSKVSTSGTSGSPLEVVRSARAVQSNYAFFARFLHWHGVSPFCRSATFAGRTLVRSTKAGPPFWRSNPAMRDTQFSSYHISPANLPHYLEKLERLNPDYIDAYPSAIYPVALAMLASPRKYRIRPRVVVTSSETLGDEQRDTIERAFLCPVRDQYGSVEMAAFAGQCEVGTYHIAPEYGLLEIIRDAGCPEPGIGPVVATGFLNHAMPLIRYQIGDIAEAIHDGSCRCGRYSQAFASLLGRMDDVITTPDGRRIGRLGPVLKGATEVAECQIIQTHHNRIEILVVPASSAGPNPARPIVDALRARLPAQVSISVRIVEKIERGPNGKLRTVVSHVS